MKMNDPNSIDENAGDGFVVVKSDLFPEFVKSSGSQAFEKFKSCKNLDRFGYVGVLYCSGKIVGLAELDILTDFMCKIDVQFLEVAEPFWGKQYGLQMLRETFELAKQSLPDDSRRNAIVTTQGYTDRGEKHILSHIDEISAEYPDVDYESYPTA